MNILLKSTEQFMINDYKKKNIKYLVYIFPPSLDSSSDLGTVDSDRTQWNRVGFYLAAPLTKSLKLVKNHAFLLHFGLE